MVLEQVCVDTGALKRLREGPLGSKLDDFCEWLYKLGFSRFTIRHHVSNVSHFIRYLEQQKLTNPSTLNSEHIRRFITGHLPRCKHRRSGAKQYHRVASSINRFTEYLQEYGLLNTPDHCTVSYQTVMEEYIKWLKDYHNSAPGTLGLRKQYLTQFLDWLDAGSIIQQLLTLSPHRIETFFLKYCQDHNQAARRSMQATLRTFFRFCFARGYIPRDFVELVPTLRVYKLDNIPRGINEEDTQRLLSSIDRNSNTGRRGYAIIQLLYTYGIRGGQVRALQLKDIDWKQRKIHFAALKHGKDIVQPLIDEVGESLLDYLQHTRPESSYPEVFLTLRAPYRPLQNSTTLSEIIARHMRAAGITAPTYGAHAFRHRFASRMLQHGYCLKSIADMIGHRCIHTTFIYTKVDFQALDQVTLDWPGEEL